MKGILFDVRRSIAGAGALLEREGVAERVEKVAGDFFASVPAGADAYMMKHIIHDWDDERAVTILRNIHEAMTRDGKVLIIEIVIPEGNEPHYEQAASTWRCSSRPAASSAPRASTASCWPPPACA